MNDIDLKGRRAIVTGGAQGIGLSVARRLLDSGAAVSLWDRDAELLEQTHAEISAFGELHRTSVELTDPQAVGRAADEAAGALGGIDILVNNAGIAGPTVPSWEYPLDEWRRVIDVDLNAVFYCCRAVVPAMREAGGGSIINISSLAAVYGMPNGLHYTTSKAAVIGLTRGLAREIGRYNIRVNAVAPNVVDTEAAGEFFGDKKDKLMEATTAQMSLRKPVTPDDLFGTMLYLASEQSSHTTGQTIMVDGGSVFL